MTQEPTTDRELDVRPLRKPDKHPAIFAAYRDLPAGSSFVLINDHDPKHLREEFEADHGASFGWDYLAREQRNWRIRITKLTAAPLPRGADQHHPPAGRIGDAHDRAQHAAPRARRAGMATTAVDAPAQRRALQGCVI